VFIDWAYLDKRGKNAAVNAVFYGTLGTIRRMAEYRGDAYAAELATTARRKIAASFHNAFFDPSRGVYADGVHDGELSNSVSEHANMCAIDVGLCNVADAVIERIFGAEPVEFTEAQPFFSSVTLDALTGRGRLDLALRILRDRWVARMVRRGASSTYEEWGRNGSWRRGSEYTTILRTESHAWSAYPAEFLGNALAGFEILSPGCREIRVQPRTEVEMDYSIEIPLPMGEVSVEKQGMDVAVHAPDGVHVVCNGEET
jgi:hypothetical protein